MEKLFIPLDTTRSALPELLSSLCSDNSTPIELASVYRERSNAGLVSIQKLRQSINANAAQIDFLASKSTGNEVVPPRDRSVDGLDRLRDILGGDKSLEDNIQGKLGSKIANRNELIAVIEKWNAHEGLSIDSEDERVTRVVIKGVMRVILELHNGKDGIQVERISCFGLKEEKSIFQLSDFALFQYLSNAGMDLISTSIKRRKRGETGSNFETLLRFCSDAPVPWR